MKILISTGIYPPDIGGPATYAKLLFDELPKKGIEVVVLSFGEVKKYPKVLRHVLFIIKLIKKIRNVDIILAQDTVSVGLPSLIVAKIFKKKLIIRVPGDYAWEQSVQRYSVKDTIDDFQNNKYGFKVELLRRIQKISVNGADLIITPSEYFKKLVSKWLINPDKAHCIYNGIDFSDFKNSSINYDPRTIITAGRLVPWKGFITLIEIMKDLPNWKLYIAGDGPMKDELQTLIKKENIANRINILGQVKRKDLIELMLRSELFILNTSFESFSFQIVEAMAVGIPVISTNIGNLSEIIDNNKNGILISPNNKKEIMDSIIKLSTDLNFRKQIIMEAKKKAQIFSIENTLNNLLKLINENKH